MRASLGLDFPGWDDDSHLHRDGRIDQSVDVRLHGYGNCSIRSVHHKERFAEPGWKRR